MSCPENIENNISNFSSFRWQSSRKYKIVILSLIAQPMTLKAFSVLFIFVKLGCYCNFSTNVLVYPLIRFHFTIWRKPFENWQRTGVVCLSASLSHLMIFIIIFCLVSQSNTLYSKRKIHNSGHNGAKYNLKSHRIFQF